MSSSDPIDPISLLRPRRKITGYSAILLPFTSAGDIDWKAFAGHVERTAAAGLIPAVNMDTGYANLIDNRTRGLVLEATYRVLAGKPYVAGVYVSDHEGDRFDLKAYTRQIKPIALLGGTPVIFQSYGLTQQDDDSIVESYQAIARRCDRFIAFELGSMFLPFGKIYSLEAYRGLLGIDKCLGAKHSSLNRELEWQRLILRDAVRPDFQVLTGNDLAIDMVMYGSDYLLGLSTFAPDLFARRDAHWLAGDPAFYQLNDALQYLGFLTFRPPVPAYKHSAAMFLKLRGWIESDLTHPQSPRRPESDREILQEVGRLLGIETYP
jgi:dihydrodipicolinate synthase/N-acetylneuraminate lyase